MGRSASRTAGWAIVALLAGPLPALGAEITLSFSDAPGGGKGGFRIERRAAGATRFEVVALVGPGVAGFVDRGLPVGATYCYRVRALAAEGGASAWSPEVCAPAEEVAAPSEPPAPSVGGGAPGSEAKPAPEAKPGREAERAHEAKSAPSEPAAPAGSEPRRIRTSGGWLQVLD